MLFSRHIILFPI